VSFCALVQCGRAIHSDVVPLSPMWFDVAGCGMMLSDVVISHTASGAHRVHGGVMAVLTCSRVVHTAVDGTCTRPVYGRLHSPYVYTALYTAV